MHRYLVIALAIGCFLARCAGRYTTYFVQEGTPPGQVVIEWDPMCPAAQRDAFGIRVEIPATGYLCTSTAMSTKWHRSDYLLQGAKGSRKLATREEIFNHSSFSFGKRGCSMEGESFFYRPLGSKVTAEIDFAALFRLRHSCDPAYRAAPAPSNGA